MVRKRKAKVIADAKAKPKAKATAKPKTNAEATAKAKANATAKPKAKATATATATAKVNANANANAKVKATAKSKANVQAKPTTIDGYLASVSPDRRAALEKLRRTIHSVLPGAEECISYSMPAFRYDGKVVAGFLATAKGCSYFPFSGTTLSTLAAELAKYDRTKSALHFDPKRALPATLVRKLIEARLAEIRA